MKKSNDIPEKPQSASSQSGSSQPDNAQRARDEALKSNVTKVLTRLTTGSKKNILARVHKIVVHQGHVGCTLRVHTQIDATRRNALRVACEKALRALGDVRSVACVVEADHSAETPLRGSPIRPQDATNKAIDKNLAQVKLMVAVASGKGGVGKSTVAVNLALALNAMGLKVGIMDADIYGPSLPIMLGLTGKPEYDEKKKAFIPIQHLGIAAMSLGLMVQDDAALIWRGLMVQKALMQLISGTHWGSLDILIVDTPPGTGDAHLTLAQRAPLTAAVIVSTPQTVALADVQRSLALFKKVHVPVVGLVENMAYFMETGQTTPTYIFGKQSTRNMAKKMDIPFLGDIPIDPSISHAGDTGRPIMADESAKTTPAYQAFMRLTHNIMAQLQEVSKPATTQEK